jgi:hypothetical protein
MRNSDLLEFLDSLLWFPRKKPLYFLNIVLQHCNDLFDISQLFNSEMFYKMSCKCVQKGLFFASKGRNINSPSNYFSQCSDKSLYSLKRYQLS